MPIINGTHVPDFLLHTIPKGTISQSSYSRFVPSEALKGAGLKASFNPNGAVIFSNDSFLDASNKKFIIPLIAKVKQLGFNVYILHRDDSQQDVLTAINSDSDLKLLPKLLDSLIDFDERTHHLLAATIHNISQDLTVLIDYQKTNSLINYFKFDKQAIPGVRMDSLDFGMFSCYSKEEIETYSEQLESILPRFIEKPETETLDCYPLSDRSLLSDFVEKTMHFPELQKKICTVPEETIIKFISSIDINGDWFVSIIRNTVLCPEAQEYFIKCHLKTQLPLNFKIINFITSKELKKELLDKFSTSKSDLCILEDALGEYSFQLSNSSFLLDSPSCFNFEKTKEFVKELCLKHIRQEDDKSSWTQSELWDPSTKTTEELLEIFKNSFAQYEKSAVLLQKLNLILAYKFLEATSQASKSDILDKWITYYCSKAQDLDWQTETDIGYEDGEIDYNISLFLFITNDNPKLQERIIQNCNSTKELHKTILTSHGNMIFPFILFFVQLCQNSKENKQLLLQAISETFSKKFNVCEEREDNNYYFCYFSEVQLDPFLVDISKFHFLMQDYPKIIETIICAAFQEKDLKLEFNNFIDQPIIFEEILHSRYRELLIADSDIQLYLERNSIKEVDLRENCKPVSAFFTKLSSDNIEYIKSLSQNYEEVVVLTIREVENIKVLQDFMLLFPKVCHVMLPSNIIDSFRNEYPDLSCEEYDIGIDLDNIAEIIRKGNRYKEEEEGSYYEYKDGETIEAKQQSLILNAPEDMVHFSRIRMCEQKMGYIRIDLGREEDDPEDGLEHESLEEQKDTLLPVEDRANILSVNDIIELQTKNFDEEEYHLIPCNLSAQKKVLLPSAAVSDEFQGFYIINDPITEKRLQENPIKLYKGVDGFLYAESQINCQIAFVTKVDKAVLMQHNYQDIPKGENPYIDKVREYIDYTVPETSEKFDITQTHDSLLDQTNFPKYDPKNPALYFQELFERRLGSCRHRVDAVYYVLMNFMDPPIKEDDIKIININNNHVILEIKHNDLWYPIDLGGGGRMVEVKGGAQSLEKKLKTAIADSKKELDSTEETADVEEVALEPLDLALYSFKRDLRKLTQISQLSDVIGSPSSGINSSLLVTRGKNEEYANYLLLESRKSNRKCFYIDGPESANMSQTVIKITDQTSVDISDINSLKEFIDSLQDDDSSMLPPSSLGAASSSSSSSSLPTSDKAILIINWDNFSTQQRLALNSLLDSKPSIQGVELDSSKLQVVSLREELPKDFSFSSRHDDVLLCEVAPPRVEETTVVDVTDAIAIDFEGYANYEEKLFGNIALKGERLEWEKTPFIDFLEQGKTNFIFTNINPLDYQQLISKLSRAKALGYFDYHGYKIPISNYVTFSLDGNMGYDFSKKLPRDTKFDKDDLNDLVALGDGGDPQKLLFSGIGDDFDFHFDMTEDFDYSEIKATYDITRNITLVDLGPSQDFHIINSQLFDLLLHGKEIGEGGLFSETPGLIEQSSIDGTPLHLFITSNLNENQWYIMLDRAEKLNVNLKIDVAPNIYIPTNLKVSSNSASTSSSLSASLSSSSGISAAAAGSSSTSSAKLLPVIVVTNDISAHSSKMLHRVEEVTIIDVEDLCYQDLEELVYKFDGLNFSDFDFKTGDILKKITSGQPVVLRGKFDPNLLEQLHSLMIAHGKYSEVNDRLLFIIEDHNIAETDSLYQPLSFLGPDNVVIAHYKEKTRSSADSAELIIEDNIAFDSLEGDTEALATEFIQTRKKNFKALLESNSLLKLSGPSGVGKTSLLEEAAQDDDSNIYYELDDLEDFASDQTDAIKILFIDESNISKCDFMNFEQLKPGGNKEIYYGKKLYQLSDKHKVIFASNSGKYGGGRVEQKLFTTGNVAEMQLDSFPKSYIYQSLLKEALYDSCTDQIKAQVSEDEFQAKAIELIELQEAYNALQTQQSQKQTIRELQQKLLEFLYSKFATATVTTATTTRTTQLGAAAEEPHMQDDDSAQVASTSSLGVLEQTPQVTSSNIFTPTDATKTAQESLEMALDVKKAQKEAHIIGHGLGTNAVLIHGNSGTGKSAMISYVLDKKSITQATPEQERQTVMATEQQICYRIDASLTLEQKRTIIIKAFDEGNIIWIDELNSCIDDGLEKILNAVLTGFHPDNKRKAAQPGFMAIFTANEIDMEGRSLISPAILHRSYNIEMTPLSQYQDHDVEQIIDNILKQSPTLDPRSQKELPQELIDHLKPKIIASFNKLRSQNKDQFSLRSFSRDLKDLLQDHNKIMEIALNLQDIPTLRILHEQEIFSLNEFSDSENNNLSHIAAASGNLDLLEFALSIKVDISDRNSSGNQPFNLAAQNGHLSIVEKLIEVGANISNQNLEGKTPLELAQENNHQDIVSAIIQKMEQNPDTSCSSPSTETQPLKRARTSSPKF